MHFCLVRRLQYKATMLGADGKGKWSLKRGGFETHKPIAHAKFVKMVDLRLEA